MSICCDLYAVADSLRAIFHEVFCPSTVTSTDQIRDDQLCVRVDSDPRPNIAPALLFFFCADILRLRSHEAPDFIALQAAHAEIANCAVVIASTRATEIGQQLKHGNRGAIGHSGSGSNAVPFNKGRNYLCLAGYV